MRFSTMDPSCLIALVIIFIADVLEVFRVRRVFSFLTRSNGSNGGNSAASGASFFETWTKLDPVFLESRAASRATTSGLGGITTMMNAVSIFALIVPIIQVSWILSQGGKKNLGLHVAICVLMMAGGLSELIVSLMMVGAKHSIRFIQDSFELRNWGLMMQDDETDYDRAGWRVLELIDIVVTGMARWLNALEWICFFLIMTILFFVIRADNNSSLRGKEACFGRKWSILGLTIGILGLFEFVANVMELYSWVLYTRISLLILFCNTIVLLPIWLFILGRQLPIVRASLENKWEREEEVELTQRIDSPDVI